MISILIPVKDDPRLDGLLTALESQAAEMAEEVEIVVVDASAGRLASIQARHSGARWVESSPVPPGAYPIPHQRNQALEAARGDLFLFIDSDCVPSPNWLNSMVRPIREHGEDMVGGAIRFAGYSTVRQPNVDGYVTRWGTGNVAMTRRLWERVGSYDVTLPGGTDYDYCLRVGDIGVRIRFLADALVDHPRDSLRKLLSHAFTYGRASVQLYRRHPASLTSLRDGHVLFTATYGLYVAALPLMLRHRKLAFTIVAPYLAGRPRSLRRQVLNITYGAGTVVECLTLLVGAAKPLD